MNVWSMPGMSEKQARTVAANPGKYGKQAAGVAKALLKKMAQTKQGGKPKVQKRKLRGH